MANNFKKCLEIILENEGGFVDHPKDPGGMTNLGVTRGTYEQYMGRHVTEEEMRSLTPTDVAPVYKQNYWDACKCDKMEDEGLALMTFDWAVNSGGSKPAKCIQKFVSAKQDGVIGPKTLGLVAEKNPREIIEYMYDSRQKYYESLRTFKTFGRGWTSRNKHTFELAMDMSEAQ
jgi:lysozyme family protein